MAVCRVEQTCDGSIRRDVSLCCFRFVEVTEKHWDGQYLGILEMEY
jgi:hypothetical protein